MGNTAVLPTQKQIEPIEGLDYYFIDLDLGTRSVIYDYLLEKRVHKHENKWVYESYQTVADKNKKTTKQISLMYHFLNEIRLLEKRAPRNESEVTEPTKRSEKRKDQNDLHNWMHKQLFTSPSSNSESTNQLPYCCLPVYYPGETVTGKLRLKTSKDFDLEKIFINFYGGAKTQFRVHHGKGHYDVKGEDKYIDEDKVLWNKDKNFADAGRSPSGGISLPPGEYEWPFSFQIPLEGSVPSVPCLNPCTVYYSLVFYRLKSVLDKGNLFSRGGIANCLGIWVEKEADVAENTANMNAIEGEKQQETGTCNDGFIQLTVKLPKSGFVIGESIPVKIELDNRSKGPIKFLEAKITLSGKYNTGSSAMACTKKFTHHSDPVISGPISSGESPYFNWTLPMTFSESEIDEHLLPPSNLDCRLMYVHYHVVVTAKRKKLQRDVVVKVPLFIGNKNSKETTNTGFLESFNPVISNSQLQKF